MNKLLQHNQRGIERIRKYEIIKKHGGEMKLKSKPVEGTTFTIILPSVEIGQGEGK